MSLFVVIAKKVCPCVLLGLALGLAGCNDPGPVERGEPRTAKAKSVRVPTGPGLALRMVGDHFEIEVTTPAGFPPAGLDPILHIGSATFVRYSYSSSVGFFGLVYAVSAAEFAALPNSAPIYIDHGGSGARQQFGVLDRSKVQ